MFQIFLPATRGSTPSGDEEWRKNTDGCVDLWIKWSEADDRFESNLEHWAILQLAARYGGELSVAAVRDAIRGPGDIEKRVEVIASVLETSLRAASAQ